MDGFSPLNINQFTSDSIGKRKFFLNVSYSIDINTYRQIDILLQTTIILNKQRQNKTTTCCGHITNIINKVNLFRLFHFTYFSKHFPSIKHFFFTFFYFLFHFTFFPFFLHLMSLVDNSVFRSIQNSINNFFFKIDC